jgi:hypothetical protein
MCACVYEWGGWSLLAEPSMLRFQVGLVCVCVCVLHVHCLAFVLHDGNVLRFLRRSSLWFR